MINVTIKNSSPTKNILSLLLRPVGEVFTVKEASEILKISNIETAKTLSRLSKQGWLVHVKRGVYSKLPLEIESSDTFTLEDPWIIVSKLYSNSYIGGWTAAEYWGLTEQIFNDICAFSSQYSKAKKEHLAGINLVLYSSNINHQFGLQKLQRTNVKVNISDPSRTIIDMLNDTRVGGGLNHFIDCFYAYINSEHYNADLLIEYAKLFGNGAIIKRLGYLAELFLGQDEKLVKLCKPILTKGKAQLDPHIKGKKLITKWQLFIPNSFTDSIHDHT